MSLKILLVDDEEQSLELLAIYIEETPDLELIGMETNPKIAYEKLRAKDIIPDVIYLDIMMPVIDGITFMHLIEDLAIPIVLTSANHNYGPASYDYDVVDYLAKVIVKERFLESIEKVKEKLGILSDLTIGIDAGILKIPGDGKRDFNFIKLEDILYIQAANTYARFFMTDGKEYLSNFKLKHVDQMLAPKFFMRVQKSFIVNLKMMRKATADSIILINNKEITIGDTYKDKFFRAIQAD